MEPISRMSSLIESARELTLDAAQSARISRSSTKSIPDSQIRKLLDSRNDREILDGLRKVISMMYRSQPCLTFFSSIVKNVASPNIEIKKLVYIYLLSHAEQEQSLALLSINTIQKSLSDHNPQVRALALKTMSGIRVPVISKIVSLAIKKGLSDMSPSVRRAAALAIPKCYRLDPGMLSELQGYLSILLGDNQYNVAGAAVKAFMEICPERIDLIHKHYYKLVKSITDMDEWSQLATLKLMITYSRKCFPKITRQVNKNDKKTKDFYGDNGVEITGETQETIQILAPDLEFLLKSIKSLLFSRNSAVIVAVVRCYIYLGTQDYIDESIGALMALLRGPQDIQQTALFNIISVCLDKPASFVRYLTYFLIHTTDSLRTMELKLEILTLIFPHCNFRIKSLILNELEHFASNASQIKLAQKVIQAIGRCAQSDSKTSSRCMHILLGKMKSVDQDLVEESTIVIRHLIQRDPGSQAKTIIRLIKHLQSTSNPKARASIIWLVGEFAGNDSDNNVAADVLRILVKGFAEEAEMVKLQIVLLAAKVYLHYLNYLEQENSNLQSDGVSLDNQLEPTGNRINEDLKTNLTTSTSKFNHPIVTLWNYVTLLARYDTSYDLRDRIRLYKSLFAIPSSTKLASLMLLAPKPVPRIPSPFENRNSFMLGSASLVVSADCGLHGIQGYEQLPDWVAPGMEPDPSLRQVELSKVDYNLNQSISSREKVEVSIHNKQLKSPRENSLNSSKYKTLDSWLAEEEDNNKSLEESDSAEIDDDLESSSNDDEDSSEGEEEDSEASCTEILKHKKNASDDDMEYNLLLK
ncbi:putative ap-3 adaptor complex subunit beta [Erysiphe necator]|uniref:Putative ap-3 adaptor complex subunit beta n=1 Tax=Uncinula necator TaxID=52586 RepID=A0A0B1P9C7_UNCNE|nr:putative ap-3 adaptor complex subunit beta [Erysiphe necator]